jgi:hypothetical protein
VRRLGILAALALAGCGGHGPEKLPAACASGPAAVLKALAAAPGAVRVGGVSLSHCFNRTASASDVQTVGGTLLAVAEQLSNRAEAHPEGAAALRLGYLIGAAQRGARATGWPPSWCAGWSRRRDRCRGARLRSAAACGRGWPRDSLQ